MIIRIIDVCSKHVVFSVHLLNFTRSVKIPPPGPILVRKASRIMRAEASRNPKISQVVFGWSFCARKTFLCITTPIRGYAWSLDLRRETHREYTHPHSSECDNSLYGMCKNQKIRTYIPMSNSVLMHKMYALSATWWVSGHDWEGRWILPQKLVGWTQLPSPPFQKGASNTLVKEASQG